MPRKKSVSNIDFFYFYPYKKNFNKGNTICQPYIKKNDEIVDHKYTLTYPKWNSVINDYIEIISNDLIDGKEINLPKQMGYLQLKKYKSTRQINYKEWATTGKKSYYKNEGDYTAILKWYRTHRTSNFKFQNHWRLRMASDFSKKLHNILTNNLNKIYNIIDI